MKWKLKRGDGRREDDQDTADFRVRLFARSDVERLQSPDHDEVKEFVR